MDSNGIWGRFGGVTRVGVKIEGLWRWLGSQKEPSGEFWWILVDVFGNDNRFVRIYYVIFSFSIANPPKLPNDPPRSSQILTFYSKYSTNISHISQTTTQFVYAAAFFFHATELNAEERSRRRQAANWRAIGSGLDIAANKVDVPTTRALDSSTGTPGAPRLRGFATRRVKNDGGSIWRFF